jgi:hypothetical protein
MKLNIKVLELAITPSHPLFVKEGNSSPLVKGRLGGVFRK